MNEVAAKLDATDPAVAQVLRDVLQAAQAASVELAGGMDNAAHRAWSSDPLTHISATAFEKHGTTLIVSPEIGERLVGLSKQAWEMCWALGSLAMDLGLIDASCNTTELGHEVSERAEDRERQESGSPTFAVYEQNAKGELVQKGWTEW